MVHAPLFRAPRYSSTALLCATALAAGCGAGTPAPSGAQDAEGAVSSSSSSSSGSSGGASLQPASSGQVGASSSAPGGGSSVEAQASSSAPGTSSSQGAGSSSTGVDGGNVPGKHVHGLVVDGLSREVIVYVPQRARGQTNAPVVMMLHGTTGTGEEFFGRSEWREKADAEGLLAVFPTALTHCYREDENRNGSFMDQGELKITTKWSDGKLGIATQLPLCTPAEVAALRPDARALVDHPQTNDVNYFTAVLDLLTQRYAVDANRIYVTGFSNGAGMSSRLSVELASRFAAGAAHAGSLHVEGPPARPISVTVSVGNLDPGVMEAIGGQPVPLDANLFTTVPQLRVAMLAPWLAALQLSDVSTHQVQTVAGKRVSRFTFANSLVGASNVLHFAVVEDAVHQYPNGTNHPIIMANLLWEFFRNQHL